MINKQTYYLPCLTLFSCLMSSSVLADLSNKDSEPVKDQISVTGAKLDNNNDITINSEQISRELSSDVKDIFRNQPAVEIGGGPRNAQRIYLNGIEGSNLNITIDGARQGRNLHQHRGSMSNIDATLLKRVEVQSGLGGDRGYGALGGAIRFTTVDAQDLLRPGQSVGAKLQSRLQSADNTRLGSLSSYALFAENIGLLAHITAANHENYRTGGGERVRYSAGHDRDYMLKLSMLDRDTHSLRLAISHNENSGIFPLGSLGSDFGILPEEPTGPSVPRRQELKRDTYTLQYQFNPPTDLVSIDGNFFYNQRDIDYPNSPFNGVKTNDMGFALSNTARFNSGIISHTLMVKADHLQEKVSTAEYIAPIHGLTGRDIKPVAKNSGLFIQDKLSWANLNLYLGGRFDHYNADYRFMTLKGHRFSPNLGLEYTTDNNLTLFASYNESIRASGVLPVNWIGRIGKNTKVHGGSLKAEQAKQYETGLQFNQSSLISNNDKFSLRVALFKTKIENVIDMYGPGRSPAPFLEVIAPMEVTGGSAKLSWHNEHFATDLAYSQGKARMDGKPVNVRRRQLSDPGKNISWQSYWQVNEQIRIGYGLNAVLRRTDVPTGTIERPGYVLHDLYFQWQPTALPELSLTLNAYNFLDKRYANQNSIAWRSDVVDEPGRDIRFGISYRF